MHRHTDVRPGRPAEEHRLGLVETILKRQLAVVPLARGEGVDSLPFRNACGRIVPESSRIGARNSDLPLMSIARLGRQVAGVIEP